MDWMGFAFLLFFFVSYWPHLLLHSLIGIVCFPLTSTLVSCWLIVDLQSSRMKKTEMEKLLTSSHCILSILLLNINIASNLMCHMWYDSICWPILILQLIISWHSGYHDDEAKDMFSTVCFCRMSMQKQKGRWELAICSSAPTVPWQAEKEIEDWYGLFKCSAILDIRWIYG